MSIQTQIERLEKLRNSLRIKLMGMDLVAQDADFEECVRALNPVEIYGYTLTNITDADEYHEVPAGYYPEGCVVGVKDPNLKGGNIRPGVSILGVESTMPDASLEQMIVYGQTGIDVYVTGKEGYVTEDSIDSSVVSIPLQQKVIEPGSEDQYIYPDEGYYGMSSVTVTAGQFTGNFSPPDPDGEIRFYDYDGSHLYSFSHEEISSMSSLPDGPVHDGLVFQGWNWTTDELRAITGKMNVGAMYITDDEATRLIIKIPSEDTKNITIAFSQNVSAGVTVNWGDNSSTETVSGTGNKLLSHEYPSKGEYTISLLPLSNCTLKLGHTSSGYNVMGAVNESTRVYSNMLRGVHLGRKVSAITSYAFQYCRALEYITIPQAVTSMGNYSFNYASSLRCAVVPSKVSQISTFTFGSCFTLTTACLPKKCTSIGASSFRYCYNLYSITIPPGLTTLNGYAFSECYSLRQVYIPDTVTSVGNFVFYKCYSLNDLHIPDTVTSVGSNSFYQNYALGYLDVPSSATNFGTYAFYDCHALAQITIPAGVTEIKAYAFMNCFGLRKVYVLPADPPAMDPSAFTGIDDECEIIVPAGTIEAYRAKNGWDDYIEHIKEAE